MQGDQLARRSRESRGQPPRPVDPICAKLRISWNPTD